MTRISTQGSAPPSAHVGGNGNEPGALETTRPGSLFPSRLLGFGVFTGWSSLSVALEVELDVAALSSPIGRLFIMALLSAILYVACAIYTHRTSRTFLGRRAFVLCAATSVLFPLLEFAAAALKLAALDFVAIACYCTATVGLFLMWNARIATHGPKTALVAYSGSFALAACIYFVISALGGIAFVLSLALLPLLSCFLLHLSDKLAASEGAAMPSEPIRWRIPWRPIVLVAILTWAFGTVTHFDGNAMIPSELGRLVAGGSVLLAALLAFDHLDEKTIAKVSALLAAASLLLGGLLGPEGGWGASKLLASVGYYGFILFVLFTLSHICYSYQARVEWLFGIVQAVYIGLGAPSGLFGNNLRELALAGNAFTPNAVMAALALVLLGACLFLLTENPFASTWGIGPLGSPAAKPAGTADPDLVTARDERAENLYRCAMIARSRGLTHREEEVLALLVDGKSFADIEAALVIAHGTLRAHVQHLYEKLDVHSKQEAIDFVSQWKS